MRARHDLAGLGAAYLSVHLRLKQVITGHAVRTDGRALANFRVFIWPRTLPGRSQKDRITLAAELERGHVVPQERAKLAITLHELLDEPSLSIRIRTLLADMYERWRRSTTGSPHSTQNSLRRPALTTLRVG